MYQMFDRILTLRVSDVMSPGAVTVNASASMEDVARLFAKRNLHCAPVVDDNDRCIGIIAASDFVRRCDLLSASDGEPHQMVDREDGIQLEPRSYDYVSECMSQGVQSVAPSTPLVAAARVMTDAHLHVLPVVEDNRAVGVLSNLDVVAAMVNAFEEARNGA
jgi:CBS domain-containing membrane protein